MKLIECSERGGNPGFLTSFGNLEYGEYCGKVKDPAGRKIPSLTELFKKMWKNGNTNGNSRSETDGKANCLKEDKGWVIVSDLSQREFLGDCSSNPPNQEHSSFIEINKPDSNVNTIKYCEKNCGTEGESSDLQSLNNKYEVNGKEIEFYKFS